MKYGESMRGGQDITEDVLNRLLPHADTSFHRENDYRISTWPCVTKDVRKWFEGAGWKQPEEWPDTARLILTGIHGLISNDLPSWDEFLQSKYRHGFGTGFISPILFCLDPQYPVINSKVVKTFKWCSELLGEPEEINASLATYIPNAKKVISLQETLAPLGLNNIFEFDLFCHFAVSKKLGGGDLTQPRTIKEPEYVACLFVANPRIYRWETAFVKNGVDWDGAKGNYPQKMIREYMKPGDRVFGYQAGPDFEIQCELETSSEPYTVADGTWAIDLVPVRLFEKPISLSTLRNNQALSKIKFVQQSQTSISGITAEQLLLLEELIGEVPSEGGRLSRVDQLSTALVDASTDTANPTRFEEILADAFEFLGFEAEHIGGSGNADVLVTAKLGSDTYTVVVDAKTRSQGQTLGQVNYQPINDHREQNVADYAVVVAPAFSGGNTVTHAEKANIGLITTDVLISIMRWHDRFPFQLAEMRRMFEVSGLASDIEKSLGRVHNHHDEFLQLVNTVLGVIDTLQRQQETSSPIDSSALYYVLLHQSGQVSASAPTKHQIDEVLAFLSGEVIDALVKEERGYVLPMPPEAVRKRIEALASVLLSDFGGDDGSMI